MLTALQIGVEDVLLASRGAVIASAGVQIISARDAEQAALCMKARQIDVVVLCHTLSPEERRRVARVVRRRRPGIPVLLVSGGRGIAEATEVDAILDPNPGHLVAFLRHLLQQPKPKAPLAQFPAARAACACRE